MTDDPNQYLASRGAPIELLFGFLSDATFACVVAPMFYQGSTLTPGDDERLRCRFAGKPATLVAIANDLYFDAEEFVAAWPRLMSDLVSRVGEAAAWTQIAKAPVLRNLDEGVLSDFLIENQIRAENFLALGEGPAALQRLEAPLRFEFKFERVTISVAYTQDMYESAHATGGSPFFRPELSSVEVRVDDVVVVIGDTLPWHEAELMEVLIVASTSYQNNPQLVVQLLEQSFPDDIPASGEVLAGLKTVWGLSLRLAGRVDDAIDLLEEVLALSYGDDANEQEASYNLGYALLCKTMKSQKDVGSRGDAGLFVSHFHADEVHREVWEQCDELFARALTLKPEDIVAEEQQRLTRQLLEVLDLNGGNQGGPDSTASTPLAGVRSPVDADVKPARSTYNRVLFALAVLALLFFWIQPEEGSSPAEREEQTRARQAESEARSRARAQRVASDEMRLEQLAGFRRGEPLPSASSEACSAEVPSPVAPREGEVIAPQLGRGVRGELYGTEHFDASVRHYLSLHAPWADVRPSGPIAVGPLVAAPPPNTFADRRGVRASVLLQSWIDPQVEAAQTWRHGSALASVLVWSFEQSRFVCSAEVRASNDPGLVFVRAPPADLYTPEDDLLNRARVDLIEQLLRGALPALRAIPEAESSAVDEL